MFLKYANLGLVNYCFLDIFEIILKKPNTIHAIAKYNRNSSMSNSFVN